MANRYWVGGTGTWDALATGNWATTSGGAGTAPAPTSADSVFFTNLSGTGVITIGTRAVCAGMNVTSIPAGLSFSCDPAFSVSVYGNLSSDTTAKSLANNYLNLQFVGAGTGLPTTQTATNTSSTFIGDVIVNGGATKFNLGLNQVYSLTLQTGDVTLTDSLTISSQTSYSTLAMYCVSLTFTSGKTYTITSNFYTSNYFQVDSSGAGGSNAIINITGATLNVGTNLTDASASNYIYFNEDFGAITLTSSAASNINMGYQYGYNSITDLQISGQSFLGDVTLNGQTITVQPYSGTPATNTFGTLTVNGALNIRSTFVPSMRINCTKFTMAGNSLQNRLYLNSGAFGTQVILNCTSTTVASVLTYVDAQDINLIAGRSLTLTSIGDLGGNTGVTATTPQTLYAISAGTVNWSSTSMWSTSSGGAAGSVIPLAQDNVTFDVNSGSSYVTPDVYNFPKITVTSGYAGNFSVYNAYAPIDGSVVTTTSTTGDFTTASTGLGYTIRVGSVVVVTGTNTGGSGLVAKSYKVSSTNNNTTFKLVNLDGTAITTVNARPSTGLTFSPATVGDYISNFYIHGTGSTTLIPDSTTVSAWYNQSTWNNPLGWTLINNLNNRSNQTLPTSYNYSNITINGITATYTLSPSGFENLTINYGTLAFGSSTVSVTGYLQIGSQYVSAFQTASVTATAGVGTAIVKSFGFFRNSFLQTNLLVNQDGNGGSFVSVNGGFYQLKFSNSGGSRSTVQVGCDTNAIFTQGWINDSANITISLSPSAGFNYFNISPFNISGNTTYNVIVNSQISGAQVSLTIPASSSTYYIAYQDINAANTIRAYGNNIDLGNNTNILFIKGGASGGFIIG
jgi:hypothetical protein